MREQGKIVTAVGAPAIAMLRTESAANTFPRLPVREGEQVFVWLARFESQGTLEAYLESLRRSTHWNEAVYPELRRRLRAEPEILRLAPTARSPLK